MDKLTEAVRRWEGWAGELHSKDDMRKYVDEWKFTWRMRLAAGEITGDEHISGLYDLEAVEKILDEMDAAQQPAPPPDQEIGEA